MRILYIIVEGQTEEEFVNLLIAPYLREKEIYDIRAIKIQTSKGQKGGFVNYDHLKNDIFKLLKSQSNIVVSTFVDFYKIPSSMPEYRTAMSLNTSKEKATELEDSFAKDINDNRFIPYIQLHEFEALLFSSITGYTAFWNNEPKILISINKIIEAYDNPEEINDGLLTAPSKRLIKIISKYNKTTFGNLIALEIGINEILNKCPRFNNWIETLIEKVKN